MFGLVTLEIRSSLAQQIMAVESAFASSFKTDSEIPAVAKVRLKKEALAESYTPVAIFTDSSCPIIGCDQLGELHISTTQYGLAKLQQQILQDHTIGGIVNVSSIDSIVPYQITNDSIVALVGKVENGLGQVKLRLFRHQNPATDAAVEERLKQLVHELGLSEPEALNYGKQLAIFRLTGVTPNAVLRLASFVGTQNIGEFQSFRLQSTELEISKTSL